MGANLDSALDEVLRLRPKAERIAARDRREHFNAIRAFYRECWSSIKATPPHRWAIDPYTVDWPRYFTPIECAIWSDIRDEGVVMYPQFPVGRYYVDFGNPMAKVAIECDGKVHLGREREDAIRQADIEAEGWMVFRLCGRECLADSEFVEDDDTGLVSIVPSPGQMLIRTLAREFKLSSRYAAS